MNICVLLFFFSYFVFILYTIIISFLLVRQHFFVDGYHVLIVVSGHHSAVESVYACIVQHFYLICTGRNMNTVLLECCVRCKLTTYIAYCLLFEKLGKYR